MIPGAGKIKDEDAERGERELKKIEAMICSMTAKERLKPSIIDPSRKRRIAAGSGTRVEDVNRLLRQFEQMQKLIKQFSGGGKKSKQMRKMMANMPDMQNFPGM